MQREASSDEETRIIQRAITGEKQAFGLLYEKYAKAIFKYVFIRLGNHEDAEDMTETVFIKAWESLSSFNRFSRGMNFRAWLYRIAHNSLVDLFRKKNESLPLDGISQIPANAIHPLKELELRESAERISGAIRQLDEKSAQVILNRFVAGMDHREIGQVMGLREGNIRIIQFRALIKLRELLGDRDE